MSNLPDYDQTRTALEALHHYGFTVTIHSPKTSRAGLYDVTAPALHTENGGYFQVAKILPRPGGAVDLVVAYRKRGLSPRYSAYRHEPDGLWKVLDGAWSDLEQAVREVPHTDRYGLLGYDPLKRFLSRAIAGAAGVPVGEGPEIGDYAEADYERSKHDYDDTPNDEGDEH